MMTTLEHVTAVELALSEERAAHAAEQAQREEETCAVRDREWREWLVSNQVNYTDAGPPPDRKFEQGRVAARAANRHLTDLEIAGAISLFHEDPPDTDFQRGYLAGLKELFVELQAPRRDV